jgi:hypothetical protein
MVVIDMAADWSAVYPPFRSKAAAATSVIARRGNAATRPDTRQRG